MANNKPMNLENELGEDKFTTPFAKNSIRNISTGTSNINSIIAMDDMNNKQDPLAAKRGMEIVMEDSGGESIFLELMRNLTPKILKDFINAKVSKAKPKGPSTRKPKTILDKLVG